MRLVSIELEGFRTFAKRVSYRFPKGPGLFFVTGENRVEPSLGANGTGKSTLWDGVKWILYGSTMRGLSAGHVESWQTSKSCYGVLEFEIGGQVHKLRRQRKPIALILDGEPVDQSVVTDLVGISADRIAHVALMGQFGVLFPDLKPTDRLTLVSEVLHLDLWTDAAARATDETRKLERERNALMERLTGAGERVKTLSEQEARLIADHQSWDERHTQHVDGLREQLVEFETRQKDCDSETRAWQTAVDERKEKHQQAEKELNVLDRERQTHSEAAQRMQGELTGFARDVKRIAGAADAMKLLRGTKCVTCKQDVGDEHLATMLEALTIELRGVQAKSAALQKDIETERAAQAEVQKLIDEKNAGERTLQRELDDATTYRNQWSTKLSQATTTLSRHRLDIQAAEAEQNPHAAAVSTMDESIAKAERTFQQVEVVLYDVQTQLDLVGYCPRLFKELRLWLVDQALDELEIHANSSLVELGLHNWRLEFTVERETKSGTIARGFEVVVYSPTNKEGVPWESWSGGETQRLRTACAIGLANLITSHMPNAPAFEVWDEPTNYVNEEGIDDLVDFFAKRAQNRQVWLIDHRTLDSGMFDGVVKIVKTKDGSRIEEESAAR
jgi:DNA repair exonuclease SbcCD ATPase subunit